MLSKERAEETIQKIASSWLPSECEREERAVPGGRFTCPHFHLSTFTLSLSWSLQADSWESVERPLKKPGFRGGRTSSGSTCCWSGKGAQSNQLSFQRLISDSLEPMILPWICASSLRLFLLPQPPLNLQLCSWNGRSGFQHREELCHAPTISRAFKIFGGVIPINLCKHWPRTPEEAAEAVEKG